MRDAGGPADIRKIIFWHVRDGSRMPHKRLGGERLPAEIEKKFRPRAEIEATIRGFTAADWARLHSVGRIFASGTDWDFEELIQEAQLRTLRGLAIAR